MANPLVGLGFLLLLVVFLLQQVVDPIQQEPLHLAKPVEAMAVALLVA